MWMIVMFDLPVGTRQERKAATGFRLALLDLGFEMAQFSVYMRFCVSQTQSATLAARVEEALPDDGKVNILAVTDKQYERIVSYFGGARQRGKLTPSQFELF